MICKHSSLTNFCVEELDRELIARGAQAPEEVQFKFKDREGTPQRKALMEQIVKLYCISRSPCHALRHISTSELIEAIQIKIREDTDPRGIWRKDNRMDFYELLDEKIKRNANIVVAICLNNNLSNEGRGFSTLKVKNYGTVFNLCSDEPFRHQPISAGRLCTGILVKEDLIITAGHCADEKTVKALRIIFDFKMLGTSTPVTQIPNEDIYKGKELIGRVYNRDKGTDWSLVKLDRKVKGHPVAKLSEKAIYPDQPVYILGHPCGLPLKYSAGAKVCGIYDSFFSADLNVYCGNSGSPVFDRETHDVIGLVARGDSQDFRWTGKDWISIIYPHSAFRSQEPQCTKVSEFIDYCR